MILDGLWLSPGASVLEIGCGVGRLLVPIAERVDAIGFFGALRDAPFERETLGGVTAGGDDGARRGEHAGAGYDALFDGLLELHIGVAGALRAEVAHGGEAGHERGAQVVDGARGAQSEALMQYLVVPGGLVVGM